VSRRKGRADELQKTIPVRHLPNADRDAVGCVWDIPAHIHTSTGPTDPHAKRHAHAGANPHAHRDFNSDANTHSCSNSDSYTHACARARNAYARCWDGQRLGTVALER
jgi:hypothetical protein